MTAHHINKPFSWPWDYCIDIGCSNRWCCWGQLSTIVKKAAPRKPSWGISPVTSVEYPSQGMSNSTRKVEHPCRLGSNNYELLTWGSLSSLSDIRHLSASATLKVLTKKGSPPPPLKSQMRITPPILNSTIWDSVIDQTTNYKARALIWCVPTLSATDHWSVSHALGQHFNTSISSQTIFKGFSNTWRTFSRPPRQPSNACWGRIALVQWSSNIHTSVDKTEFQFFDDGLFFSAEC